MLAFLRRPRGLTSADVSIAAPTRTFEFTFRNRSRLLLRWTWTRQVRRRYVVTGLPFRELLVLFREIRRASDALGGLTPAEYCVFIVGRKDPLWWTDAQHTAVLDFFNEANHLPKGEAAVAPPAVAPSTSSSPTSTSSSDGTPSTSTTDGSSA